MATGLSILQFETFIRHTGIPGLWTQELDAGQSERWTLDSGRWTLDAGHWTLDSGLWTLDTVVDCSRTELELNF